MKNFAHFMMGIILFLLFHILPILEGTMNNAPVWYWIITPVLFGAAGICSGNIAEMMED